jgi:hypothetical protein
MQPQPNLSLPEVSFFLATYCQEAHIYSTTPRKGMRKAFVLGFEMVRSESWQGLQRQPEQSPEYATSFGKKSFNIRIAAPKPKRAGMLKRCATAAKFNPFAVVVTNNPSNVKKYSYEDICCKVCPRRHHLGGLVHSRASG